MVVIRSCGVPRSVSMEHKDCTLFVSMGFLNGTLSFSTLFMAVMTSCGVKVSEATPSKHFLRCGCTRVGSLVSDRISSISSLDRKKKLRKGKQEAADVNLQGNVQ